MKRTTQQLVVAARLGVVALWIGCLGTAGAAPLINFSFNEGSGMTTADSVSALTGMFGVQQNPLADYVQLMDASPSGTPGDRCITNSGTGFLVADDSALKVLDITNGPITIESWIYIDFLTPAKASEGIVAYGGSYKMGMRGGRQVFTLFGNPDVNITNTAAGQIAAGQWVHLAAAWEPGVGVHFYVDGTEYFESNTNLAARPVAYNYLSIASEGLANNSVAAFDRVRIHQAVLSALDLDSVAATPKSPHVNTLVSYNFDEPAFPCTNAIAPPLPTMFSSAFLPAITSPVWTNDTPSGLAGDYGLAFLTENPVIKEVVTVNYGATTIDLAANNTNYTLQAWVKLPTGPLENRRVIARTDGPAPRVSLSINATRGLHTTILGNTDFVSSTLVPNDGRWHHVAAVMVNFAQVRFYLDGILRQTINRTSANPLTSGGTAGLLIGKESDTLFFRGLLDRVLIHNDALAISALDFPAIPGLATFPSLASHPTDVATNLGATVKFTAAPTSTTEATYQWRYRTNLADAASVALSGETTTNLVLSNITTQHFGYYSLLVSNAAGVTESYAARLRLTPNLNGKLIDFELPTYTSGILEGQDEWINDQNGNAVRVLTASEIAAALMAGGLTPGQTVHSGSQALLVNGANVATSTVRQFTGLETKSNVVFEVWARPLAAGTLGTALGNVFFTIENAAGTRAAGIRFGPAFSIDYGLVSGSWVASGLTADPNTWYRFTLRLNYTTRTYDFLVDGVRVNGSPIPFYTATSESFRQVRIFRGANQAGMIVDDLNVPAPLKITSVSATGGILTINWQGGTPPYQLQRRATLDSGDWEDVGSTTSVTQGTDTIGNDHMFYRVGSD